MILKKPISLHYSDISVRRQWCAVSGIRMMTLSILCLLTMRSTQAQSIETNAYSGTANPAAVIVMGHARFTVLTPQLIRMEWASDSLFEDRPSLVFLNRTLPVPLFRKDVHRGILTLRTNDVELRYDARRGNRFAANNLQVSLKVGERWVTWHPGDAATGNLMGTTRTLDNAVGAKTPDPIEQGLVSHDGWAVVDDSQRPLFDSDDFTFARGEQSVWPWVVERPAGSAQDLYFFGYGHAYEAALGDFVKVAGRIPLPPRFAFGSWWSRYWAYSDEDLNELVDEFRENNVPLDVLVIDMDWHKTAGRLAGAVDQSGHVLGWSGYSWDKLLFPDPQQFLATMHTDGVKLTLNLHDASGIQPWEDAYPKMARAMSIDPTNRKYVPADYTDKRFASAFIDLVQHPLEQQGVDFWWLDWQQERQTKIADLNPVWWLNYIHFTDQEREGKRPLLFHRWGGLGNHRYQIGFSGDTYSTWESLAFQPGFTATAANVGYAYWSHDIGGHIPGAVDPEMYTRWVQFGVLSPILRTHTTKAADGERRIWAYPEPYSEIMRKSYRWRYAIEPYLYTEARRTYDTGVAFVHPLYYDWPEQQAAYDSQNEYVFGTSLVAAPIVGPVDAASNLASRDVWIPPGEWIETSTGTYLTGPELVVRRFSLAQTPLYARAGAIVPMQPEMRYTGQLPVDPLIATVYPLAADQQASYKVYEDDGHAEDYQHSVCAWTTIEARQTGDDLAVTFLPVEGSYPGMLRERHLQVVLPDDWPPVSVMVNGEPLRSTADNAAEGWRYEGNTLSTTARTRSYPVNTSVIIVFHRKTGMLQQRALLNGFPGAIERLRTSLGLLNSTWPVVLPPNVLIEAAQTGNRIGYAPSTALTEMQQFADQYRQALASVTELHKATSLSDSQIMTTLAISNDMQKISKALPLFRTGIAKAMALLEDGLPPPKESVTREGTAEKKRDHSINMATHKGATSE